MDCPVLGRRLNEMRNSFTLPENMQFPNLLSNGRKEFSGDNAATAFGMGFPHGPPTSVADPRRRCKS